MTYNIILVSGIQHDNSMFFIDYTPCKVIKILTAFPALKSFPGGSDGKVSAYNVGDWGFIPGLGWCPGEGNVYPL